MVHLLIAGAIAFSEALMENATLISIDMHDNDIHLEGIPLLPSLLVPGSLSTSPTDIIIILVARRFRSSTSMTFQHCCAEQGFSQST